MVESLSELIGSESPEMPMPADVVSYSKDVEMEAVKSEVLLGEITGTSSPRVSSSFTPKHDSNFDISFTDTGMYVWIWVVKSSCGLSNFSCYNNCGLA